MALLNRPMTEDEARKLIAAWRKGWPAIPSFYDMLEEALREPAPHVVHYHTGYYADCVYISPKQFYASARLRLSDCVWIVPGTLERRI